MTLIDKIYKEIKRCDVEIAKANKFGRRAVASGNFHDQQMAGIWMMDWEITKNDWLAKLQIELANQTEVRHAA